MAKSKGKAETLVFLKDKLSLGRVLPLIKFSPAEWENAKNITTAKASKLGESLIVRSSSSCEDGCDLSNAGKYASVPDVAAEQSDITQAVAKVIRSMEPLCPEDEIFIQPMLKNVSMCGVVFTADINTLSPYYTVSFDTSGATDTVTGGHGENVRTFVCARGHEPQDRTLADVIRACAECETILGTDRLDIEFAVCDDEIYILQARPLSLRNKEDLSDIDISTCIMKMTKKIQKLNAPHPKLLGDKTLFGVMPDWNPAEIIGTKPKQLALSLYKELITDNIWAYQRDNYGYRNLRSCPLMVSFMGMPYIDVRVSFNSFVPKSLSSSIAKKLVNYYLDELASHRNKHDKVEFEIVFSCYYFGIAKRLSQLKDRGFTENEIKSIELSLMELTNKVIDSKCGLFARDMQKIEKLKELCSTVTGSDMPLIDKIYWLLEDCKRFGTLPFAGIARAAFIATQLLRSMEDEGIISDDELCGFMNSLSTVSKQLTADITALSEEDFCARYGHLRPGTYDIMSRRYDEAYHEYFSGARARAGDHADFHFSAEQLEAIGRYLAGHGLKISTEDFIQFIRSAIEGREYSKLVFTMSLSKVLVYVEELGTKYGISRESLAHLNIKRIMEMYSELTYEDVRDLLLKDIETNTERYRYTKAIRLPGLIAGQEDVSSFFIENNEPNFITLGRVRAAVTRIGENITEDLSGRIVCTPSADPGYDYLFTKNIAGLITCYGGANSHMAVRCAELGIPAVIGCGENSYSIYSEASFLEIDSLNKHVRVIS